jgi:hypothetical protein
MAVGSSRCAEVFGCMVSILWCVVAVGIGRGRDMRERSGYSTPITMTKRGREGRRKDDRRG